MIKLCMTMLMAIVTMTAAMVDASAPASNDTVVWGVSVSPYVRKVLVTLEYKGIPYTNQEILPRTLLEQLGQKIPEQFTKASPLGKIPALQEGDFSVADSAVIAAYLEKKYPQKPLYPLSPAAYGQALWLEKYADTVMSDVIHQKIFVERFVKPNVLSMPADEKKANEAIAVELPKIFDYLEGQLKDGKKYLVGNSFTIADIAVATHFVSLQLSKVELDAKRWPKLAAYIGAILKEPSFAKMLSK